MKTKSILLGLASYAILGAAFSQEFVVTQIQTNTPPACQENCSHDATQNSQTSALLNQQTIQQTNQQSNKSDKGENNVQIDRSGVDKAAIHLQILQQAAPHFTEGSAAKKAATEEKKTSTKTQDNS